MRSPWAIKPMLLLLFALHAYCCVYCCVYRSVVLFAGVLFCCVFYVCLSLALRRCSSLLVTEPSLYKGRRRELFG